MAELSYEAIGKSGLDYTQPSGMEPIIAQIGISHDPRKKIIANLETDSGKHLPLEQTRTSQVVVLLDTKTGDLSHKAFEPTIQLPAFSDLSTTSRTVYQAQQEQLANQPDVTLAKRTLKTALKEGTTKPVVLFSGHDSRFKIPKPKPSFRLQGGDPSAKIPKTGGYGLNHSLSPIGSP